MRAGDGPLPIGPLLPDHEIDRLRSALLESFTSADVHDALGLAGESALARGDRPGVRRQLTGSGATPTLIRLFLLGESQSTGEIIRTLPGIDLPTAIGAGLLVADGERLRAGLDLRPYSEQDGPDWWVVSDLGSDVSAAPLSPEHVLGIGAAGLLLAQVTVREPVARSLDIGTGCGVQALHLARHSGAVTATDVSRRALRYAATTAALNRLDLDLREGSMFEPVSGERFDLVVCNPPFVVGPASPGNGPGWTYRDSGWAGDAVCRRLISGVSSVLAPGGTAQFLANWQISADESWPDRVGSWIPRGCDSWVWQREVATPDEYASLWLRDAGLTPDGPTWRSRYDQWLDWFAEQGVLAIGMGVVTLRHTGLSEATVVCEDVPQAIEQPSGRFVHEWLARARWLAAKGEQGLLDSVLTAAPGLVLDRRALLTPDGWEQAYTQLRQLVGVRWEVEVDDMVAGVVAACQGRLPVRTLASVVAAASEVSADEASHALVPVLTDLVRRGFLLPG